MTSRKQIKEAMNNRVKERGKVKKADTARRGEEKVCKDKERKGEASSTLAQYRD